MYRSYTTEDKAGDKISNSRTAEFIHIVQLDRFLVSSEIVGNHWHPGLVTAGCDYNKRDRHINATRSATLHAPWKGL
jgi:hypothetical protein